MDKNLNVVSVTEKHPVIGLFKAPCRLPIIKARSFIHVSTLSWGGHHRGPAPYLTAAVSGLARDSVHSSQILVLVQ